MIVFFTFIMGYAFHGIDLQDIQMLGEVCSKFRIVGLSIVWGKSCVAAIDLSSSGKLLGVSRLNGHGV